MCESCLYGDGGATGGMWDGVRCDIDDRSVSWSPISPWLNVRSQWKGGTANATKSQWQPDPWERETTFFFNQILLLCPPPLLTNLHSNFFSPSCFLSCLIHLFLTFGFSVITNRYLQLFWPLFTFFFSSIHTKEEAKSRPFHTRSF